MTSNPQSSDKSAASTLSNIMFRPVWMIWRAIFIGLVSIELIGGLVLLRFLSMDEKMKRESDPNTDTHTGGIEATQPHRSTQYLAHNTETFKKICKPTSPWVPLVGTTTVILYIFRALEDHIVILNDSASYCLHCPTDGRRTQTSAFVKLFAASVTTICIHGHLGSLAGSGSWKRELFRAVEVLVSPLSFLFSTAAAVWYEVASLPMFRESPWIERIGLKYRLARMCCVRVDSDMPSSSLKTPNPYVGVINPVHVQAVPLRRDLKWYGRVLLLVILFAQYVQAAVLLTRRIITHTAATIDMAMFFMVLSGLVALSQSLTISLINQSWVLSPSTTGDEFCIAKGCRLPECVAFKAQQGLPNETFVLIMFGYDIASILRQLLHELAGGYLQWMILDRSNSSREPWWQIMAMLFGMHHFWKFIISTAAYTDLVVQWLGDGPNGLLEGGILPSGNPPTSSPDEGHDETAPAPIPVPATATEKSDRRRPVGSMLLLGLPFLGIFICGLVPIAFGLLAILFNLTLIVWPCVYMYAEIALETTVWKASNATEPCPQLWKDGLEDELWWF